MKRMLVIAVLLTTSLLVARSWSASIAAGVTPAPAVVGLDHIPVAVADLEGAARRYRELGFALKEGRPHANGIRNQHVKFRDGTELELITAPEARDPLTTTYRRHLEHGDGPAFLALFAPHLDDAAAQLAGANIAFQHKTGYVDIPDAHPLGYIFLARRNHSPTDRPEHFAHANGAESLVGVWLAGGDLTEERRLLVTLGAVLTDAVVRAPDAVRTRVARFAEGEVVFLPASRQLVPGRRIVGATLRVRSLDAARRVVGRYGLAVPDAPFHLLIPPSNAHGLWIELRERP